MNYIETKDITKATHWIALEDDRDIVKDFLHITIGKKYELIPQYEINGELDDYFIYDDANVLGMFYMFHNGYFIIK